MSFQRHDYRGQAPQKYGKPTVTYPYGDTRFPRIVEVRTAKKGTDSALLLPFLTPHRDQQSFPGAVLVEQTADSGDDTDKNISETYEVLPGPIFVEVSSYKDTGIPMLVSRQKRAATDVFMEGELSVGAGLGLTALNVLSVTAGNPCTVTLNVSSLSPQDHLLSPRMWVTFAGTGTALDADGGVQRILGVPAANQLTFAVEVTSAVGAAGTVTPVNHIAREIKATNNASVNVKVDSAVAVPDVTAYDEDVGAWKDYSFPDTLVGIVPYLDLGNGEGAGTVYSYSFTIGAAYGLSIQHGYRGPCVARRLRCFSMGAGAGTTLDDVVARYAPTLVMPSSGTVACESFTFSEQASGESSAFSNSFTWRTGTVPPILTQGYNGWIGGLGGASVRVTVPPSTPGGFEKDQPITLLEQPQRLDAGLWEIYVWQISCPYDTFPDPLGAVTYASNPVVYSVGTAITPNVPTIAGGGTATNWSIPGTAFDALPPGLSMDPTTGIISGTPTEVGYGSFSPTVFASNASSSAEVILAITIII